MLTSIPAYWWAKEGRQGGCKVSCKAVQDGAIGEGRKAWLTAHPGAQLPSGPVCRCSNLPGLAWEHSDPASDNVDLHSDRNVSISSSLVGFSLGLRSRMMISTTAEPPGWKEELIWCTFGRNSNDSCDGERCHPGHRAAAATCNHWLGLLGSCASSQKKLNSEHSIFSLVS